MGCCETIEYVLSPLIIIATNAINDLWRIKTHKRIKDGTTLFKIL